MFGCKGNHIFRKNNSFYEEIYIFSSQRQILYRHKFLNILILTRLLPVGCMQQSSSPAIEKLILPLQKQSDMLLRLPILILSGLLLCGCTPKKAQSDEALAERKIIRFDSLLYHYLTQNEPDETLTGHRKFLDEFGEKIIGIGRSDSAGFYDRLKSYFSEPHLMQLYTDEQRLLSKLSHTESELLTGLNILLQHFPDLHRPEIYLHVSGWGQNVVVTDRILSLSADKYLGTDYPPYHAFFYDYQRRNMSPDRMAPDYLLGFLMASFPFRGEEEILLHQIIYEGKLRYILSRLLPRRRPHEYVGYTPEQYDWCSTHRGRIWKTILDNQHLFRADYLTTSAYLREAPSTSTLPPDSPGRVGIWLGYQIVASYMKHHPRTTWRELIDQTDYPSFLQAARFHPMGER
jgi:hypothetical protein